MVVCKRFLGLPLAFVPVDCPNIHWKGSLYCDVRLVCLKPAVDCVCTNLGSDACPANVSHEWMKAVVFPGHMLLRCACMRCTQLAIAGVVSESVFWLHTMA